MAAPTVPFFGKDSERLAKLGIAYKALLDSDSFLKDWPSTVPNHEAFKQKIDAYQEAFEEAIHRDRRSIAKRIGACDEAGTTWQKIVNYACSTHTDNSALLEHMGVTAKTRRGGFVSAGNEPAAPDFVVANLAQRGMVRGSCPPERRRYTYVVEVTEGDPRVEEGWYQKGIFSEAGKMDMDGFQSGKEYSFRCRIVGRNNMIGPWSHVVTLMVT